MSEQLADHDAVNSELELTSIEDAYRVLQKQFPNKVTADGREGYEGVVVAADALQDVALFIRDQMGFGFLSSVTGVDYLSEGKLESVYHAFGPQGGALVFKVQVDRDPGELPSLVSVWPSADFQEREAYDMVGLRYLGHPNLQRILTWEGFHGYPLRKDWHEPYFEEEHKPFSSRHPEGHVYRHEDRNPFHKNVQYPPDFDPDTWEDIAQSSVYEALDRIAQQDGLADRAVGHQPGAATPQHPRRIAHRGRRRWRDHCRFAARFRLPASQPRTDRRALHLPADHALHRPIGLYLLHVQQPGLRAGGGESSPAFKPPERAEYIRVIMAELTRIVNHLLALGFLWNDLGAFYTPVVYGFNERELVLDLFEMASGSRMMCNYMRVGGVFEDLPDGWMEKARHLVFDRLPRFVEQFDRLMVENEIFRARSIGVGILPPDLAVALGATGPLLRGSGVPYDIRRVEPYSIYDRFDFDVAVRYNGDVYDRFMVRLDEMHQSLRILAASHEPDS